MVSGQDVHFQSIDIALDLENLQVLSFAREHFVTVVPVIETPGHILAALAAYPEPLGWSHGLGMGTPNLPYGTSPTYGGFMGLMMVNDGE